MPKVPDFKKEHWHVGDSFRCPQCGEKGICFHKDELNRIMNVKFKKMYGDPRPDFMLDGKVWRDDIERAKKEGVKLQPYQALQPNARHDQSIPSPRHYGEWKLIWQPSSTKRASVAHEMGTRSKPPGSEIRFSTLPQIGDRNSRATHGLEDYAHSARSREWFGNEDINQRAKMLDMLAPVDLRESSIRSGENMFRDSSTMPPFVTAAWKHLAGGSRFLSPEVPDMIDERRQCSVQPVVRVRSRQDVLDCMKHITNLQKRNQLSPRAQRRLNRKKKQ